MAVNKESFLETDNLRMEVGVLQEKIQAFIPAYGKFKIPSLMEGGNDEDIELYVPYHLTFDWGDEWIPEGTRFIIASIAGNISDMRVVGRYDRNEDVPNPSEKLAQYIIQLIMLKAREQSIFDFCYENDERVACHHARAPRDTDVGDLVPNNYDELDYGLWEGPEIDADKTNYVRGVKV